MGITFDILYDRILLAETSEFSKFFTGTRPINIIHDILKVSHDTNLVLSPTNNRHEMWNVLRDGKAIFARINKPKTVEYSLNNLLQQIKSLPEVPGRNRSRNEISEIIKKEINTFLDEYYDRYTGLYLKSKSFLNNLNRIKWGEIWQNMNI